MAWHAMVLNAATDASSVTGSIGMRTTTSTPGGSLPQKRGGSSVPGDRDLPGLDFGGGRSPQQIGHLLR
jgi:hypothetical protein